MSPSGGLRRTVQRVGPLEEIFSLMEQLYPRKYLKRRVTTDSDCRIFRWTESGLQSQNASGYQNLTCYGDNVGGLEWKRPLHKGWRTRLFSIDCDFSPPAMLDSLSFVCEQNYCFGQRSFVDFLSKYMLTVRNGISRSEVPNISFIPLRLSHAPNDHK
jgi:hypothetical protein